MKGKISMFLSYYRNPEIMAGGIKNMSVPLQLNCAGYNAFPYATSQNTVDQDYYLLYLCEGEYQLQLPIEETMTAGHFIIFDAEKPFSYSTDGKLFTAHYFAHFTVNLASSLLAQCHIAVNTIYPAPQHEKLSAAFQTLFSAFLCRDELFDADAAQKLVSLLIFLGRNLHNISAVPDKHTGAFPAKRLERSLQYLHENFAKEISVEKLAEMEYLSVSRYRELFTVTMKHSPYHYLIQLRMKTACDLLGTTQLSIQQIAQAVGYEDQRYFANLFRKTLGVTPSKYRMLSPGYTSS